MTGLPDPAPASAPVPDLRTRRRRQRAWYWYDWANSGYWTSTATVLIGPYLISVAEKAACPPPHTGDCAATLSLLGVPLAPGSIPGYTVALATILMAILLPIVGAVADRSRRPTRLLGGFAWVGSLAACLLFTVTGDNWLLGVILLLVANTCFGCTLGVYDSLLVKVAEPDERDRVSSRGWAMGYLGGFLLLAANMALLVMAQSGTGPFDELMAVRVSMLSAGLWWGLFTLVPVLGLRHLPVQDVVPLGAGSPVTAPFKQLAVTLRDLRRFPQTGLFLLAYLFYNDGVQTVISSSSVFGSRELQLSTTNILLTFLLVQFIAVWGAIGFGVLARHIGAYKAIFVGIAGWLLVVAIAFFVPSGQFAPFLALAALIGLVMGGTQALSRSLFSQLVPRDREAEYFSLYQATERGTSWFGALLFSLVFQFAGSYRPSILSLVALFAIGGFLLTRVKIRQGIEDAGNTPPSTL